MARRAYRKGYLRLSPVTCPIELFPAVSQSEKRHFHTGCPPARAPASDIC
jgi:DNA end-binding protein Ku